MITTPIDSSKLVSQPTIATMLNVTRRTLRRMILSGQFPAAEVRLSKTLLRWRRSTVDKWIEYREHEASRGR